MKIKQWFNLSKKNHAFTMVELLVVILIIGLLLGIGVNSYGKFYDNAKENTVEQELGGWMSDINQYMEDYGKLSFSASVKGISSQTEYLAYIYKGDVSASTSDISTDAHDFESGAFLGLLQKYISESLCLESVDSAVYTDDSNHYTVLSTRVKRDPWGGRYYFYINTVNGVTIVLSGGPDGTHNVSGYASGIYGDDKVLIVDPK